MKRMHNLGYLLLLAAALTACMKEGAAGFSGNDQAILITDARLITWDLETGAYEQIESAPILWGFGASMNQVGDVLYAKLSSSTIQVCIYKAKAGASACPVTLGSGAVTSGGVLSYLPSGGFMAVYENQMHVYTERGVETALASDAGQFVTVPYIVKAKRNSPIESYMKPYAKSGCAKEQNPCWVVIQEQNSQVYRYCAGANLQGPTLLPRRITSEIRAVLEDRHVAVTGAALSPDGTRLVIRANRGSTYTRGPWDLYVLDLDTNSGGLLQLVEGADFAVQYAFSPCGDQLAYESGTESRSVWILDFGSGIKAELVDGASMPQWYPE